MCCLLVDFHAILKSFSGHGQRVHPYMKEGKAAHLIAYRTEFLGTMDLTIVLRFGT